MNIETYYPSAEALNLRIDMKATCDIRRKRTVLIKYVQSDRCIAAGCSPLDHRQKPPEARELNLPSRDTEV